MSASKLGKSWAELSQLAVVLCSALGGFLLPPPAGFLASQGLAWPRLAQFIVSVMAGLLIVAGARRRRARDAALWARWAIASLALALAALFGYFYLVEVRTCRYYTNLVIIGSELTQHAGAYAARHSVSSCEELLKLFTGRSGEIWTRGSLIQSELALALSYIAVMPLLAGAAITTLQAVHCSRATSGAIPHARRARTVRP
jgi:hypothetical protein